MKRFQWMKEFASAGYGLFRHPANTTALLRVGDLIAETNWFLSCVQKLKKQDPSFASRQQVPLPELQILKNYEPSTLGYQYYEFMTKNGLSVYPSLEMNSVKVGNSISSANENEKIWLRERSRQIHDLLHVILDLGIEVESEIKLNAHLMYSLNLPISRLIVCGGMLRLFLTDFKKFASVHHNLKAIKLWCQSKECLLLLPIETWLDEPTDKIRKRLGLAYL